MVLLACQDYSPLKFLINVPIGNCPAARTALFLPRNSQAERNANLG